MTAAADPIAFYAPLKSPCHPVPSGDRTMARLLMRALEAAGFAPFLASEARSLDLAGDPDAQRRIRAEARAEADGLIARWRARPPAERPRLWFTYHVYYKAPDWIGPRVAEALHIPYVVAEASRAPRRADGPWALGHRGAEAALDRADAIFVVTEADRVALERARPAGQRLLGLPPFIALDDWGGIGPASSRRDRGGPVRLLAVAMMRRGDKLASYALLAEALAPIDGGRWVLDLVGDGEARAEVDRLFAPFGSRVRRHGAIEERDRLAGLYASADVFVWPAVNEAYGLALLEAQAFGCPVVAGGFGGVASVVRDGETGILTPPGDARLFARALSSLLDDPPARRRMGEAARAFVRRERTLAHAAARLRAGLAPLMAKRSAA